MALANRETWNIDAKRHQGSAFRFLQLTYTREILDAGRRTMNAYGLEELLSCWTASASWPERSLGTQSLAHYTLPPRLIGLLLLIHGGHDRSVTRRIGVQKPVGHGNNEQGEER